MSKRIRTNVHVDHVDPKVGGLSGYVGRVSVNGVCVWTSPRCTDGRECLRVSEAQERAIRAAG